MDRRIGDSADRTNGRTGGWKSSNALDRRIGERRIGGFRDGPQTGGATDRDGRIG
jgi:hypothetical protein